MSLDLSRKGFQTAAPKCLAWGHLTSEGKLVGWSPVSLISGTWMSRTHEQAVWTRLSTSRWVSIILPIAQGASRSYRSTIRSRASWLSSACHLDQPCRQHQTKVDQKLLANTWLCPHVGSLKHYWGRIWPAAVRIHIRPMSRTPGARPWVPSVHQGRTFSGSWSGATSSPLCRQPYPLSGMHLRQLPHEGMWRHPGVNPSMCETERAPGCPTAQPSKPIPAKVDFLNLAGSAAEGMVGQQSEGCWRKLGQRIHRWG